MCEDSKDYDELMEKARTMFERQGVKLMDEDEFIELAIKLGQECGFKVVPIDGEEE